MGLFIKNQSRCPNNQVAISSSPILPAIAVTAAPWEIWATQAQFSPQSFSFHPGHMNEERAKWFYLCHITEGNINLRNAAIKFHLCDSNTLSSQLWMLWHQARSVHCLPTQMANFWYPFLQHARYLSLVPYKWVFSELRFIYYLILHCPARYSQQQSPNYVSLWCKNSSSGSGYDQGWDFENQGLIYEHPNQIRPSDLDPVSHRKLCWEKIMETKQSSHETSPEHPPSLQGFAAQGILEN